MAWDEEDLTNYLVVVNHEEQYSIWPDYKEIPGGWEHVGESGPKQQCLEYIEKVWTDMRPLSLRIQMEEWEKERQAKASNDDTKERAASGALEASAKKAEPVNRQVKKKTTTAKNKKIQKALKK